MWPWNKGGGADCAESCAGAASFYAGLCNGFRELVLAPRDAYAKRFLRSIGQLEEQARTATSERDIEKLSRETEINLERFAQAQRESVEKVISDLDASLRDLLGVIDETMLNGDDFVGNASSVTSRLACAVETNSLEEVRSIIRQEVRALAHSVKTYRDANQSTMIHYARELEVMRERLDQAQESARTDGLTHLPNRVSHEFYLNAMIAKAREGSRYSMALLDLDGFKAINDTYGHQAGDAALVAFAERMKQFMGAEGFVARLGGDEFTVVARMSGAELERKLEVFRSEMPSRPVDFGEHSLAFGTSYGVVDVDGSAEYAKLMADADDRMYRFKRKNKRSEAA